MIVEKIRNEVILEIVTILMPVVETKQWGDVERKIHSPLFNMFNEHNAMIVRKLTDASNREDTV